MTTKSRQRREHRGRGRWCRSHADLDSGRDLASVEMRGNDMKKLPKTARVKVLKAGAGE